MRRLHTILTLLLALGLIVSIVLWRSSRRDLQHQLQKVTNANDALRESLGELTKEITKKEREIDELAMPCTAHDPVSRNRL